MSHLNISTTQTKNPTQAKIFFTPAHTDPIPPMPPFSFPLLKKSSSRNLTADDKLDKLLEQNNQIMDSLKTQGTALNDIRELMNKQSTVINNNSVEINKLQIFAEATRCEIGDVKMFTAHSKPTSELIIYGVPRAPSVPIPELIKKILESISRGNLYTFIIDIREFSPPNRMADENCGNYVVQFVSDHVRDSVVAAYHAKKKSVKGDLTYEVVFGTPDIGKIVIKELMSKHTHSLLSKAVEVKKEKNWQGVWASKGNVFVRKSANSLPNLIFTPSDLDSLK